ncbi:MAG TPA: hypothetical protein DIV42_07215 [Alteromonas macleodii]|jgi:hypothetical protein|nr:sulfotransferase [Alteromonas macleodii]MBS51027.1 hypothetical protein [Sphingobium sp.]HCS80937.1 hypothetical protein [Alteromonas macleodii]|tara:strand:+ start:4319 stop:5149 length:831 start_codon:yes stop_codon:yes gene_type:complete
MGIPNFLCIGMQKGGTTWLYDVLKQHPSITNMPAKEFVFFNNFSIPEHNEWPVYHRRRQALESLRLEITKGSQLERDEKFFERLEWFNLFSKLDVDIDWYEKLFDIVPEHKIAGDYSPDYIMLPRKAIRDIKDIYPEIKAVLSVRNPVDRAWSHMKMIVRNEGLDIKDVSNLLNVAKRSDVLRRGHFIEDLENWKDIFQDDFLYYKFDAINIEPLKIIRKVCDLLEIEFNLEYFINYEDKVFSGQTAAMPDEVRTFLENTYCKEVDYFENLPLFTD